MTTQADSFEVRIEADTPDVETSLLLSELASDLAGEEGILSLDEVKVPQPPGHKALDTVAVLTVTLTAINTLVAVLQYRMQSRPTYTLELQVDGAKLTIESNDPGDLEAKLRSVRDRQGKRRVRIVLRQRG